MNMLIVSDYGCCVAPEVLMKLYISFLSFLFAHSAEEKSFKKISFYKGYYSMIVSFLT